MGLKRNNRHRQAMGKLLDLTKPQQEERQEWQASRPLTWKDKLIYAPDNRAGFMSWGLAVPFSFEEGRFMIENKDMPGCVRITKVIGSSNVVRTDTTDRMSRAKSTRRRVLLDGMEN